MKKLLMLLSLFLGFSSMQAMDFLKKNTGKIGSFIVLAGVTYGIYTKYFKGATQLPATAAPKSAETTAKQEAEAAAPAAIPVAKPVTQNTQPAASAQANALASGHVVIEQGKPASVQVVQPAAAAPKPVLAQPKSSNPKTVQQVRALVSASASVEPVQEAIPKALEPIAESPTNSKPLPSVLRPQIRNLRASGIPKDALVQRYSQYTDAKQFINSL